MASACASSSEFNPPPATYSETQTLIDGMAAEQTIAAIDSTFFGRNQPMLGRRFTAEDYSTGAVAILSSDFWREHFEERPDVVGTELEVGGVVRRIVGVMPQGINVPPNVALWIPKD